MSNDITRSYRATFFNATRTSASSPAPLPSSSSAFATAALASAGRLSHSDAAILADGLSLQLDLQQALRIAAGDGFDPEKAPAGQKAWLAKHLGETDFSALEARLKRAQAGVEAVRTRKLGPLTTEQALDGV